MGAVELVLDQRRLLPAFANMDAVKNASSV